ncbi:MAG: hypothetical protein WCL11_07565 [Verrucomicrobiota bacterium]
MLPDDDALPTPPAPVGSVDVMRTALISMHAIRFLRTRTAWWLLAAVLAGALSWSNARNSRGATVDRAGAAASAATSVRKQTNSALADASLPAVPKPAPSRRSEWAPAFGKTTPTSLDDLKAIERQVKAVAGRVSPAVVAVQVGYGSGSGWWSRQTASC